MRISVIYEVVDFVPPCDGVSCAMRRTCIPMSTSGGSLARAGGLLHPAFGCPGLDDNATYCKFQALPWCSSVACYSFGSRLDELRGSEVDLVGAEYLLPQLSTVSD